MAQLAATAEAVVSMYMQPHGVWGIARCPTLRAELQRAGLLDRDAFGRRVQMGFRDIQGIGQPLAGLCLEHAGVATLNLADALGMDARLSRNRLFAHLEGNPYPVYVVSQRFSGLWDG